MTREYGGVPVSQLVPYLVAPMVTAVLTGVVRRYALRHEMIDIPNARSSHTAPTPRGGGIAFVAVFLALAVWTLWSNGARLGMYMALVGGGFAVAAVGWLDDRYRLSAGLRAAVHSCAALWALSWLGGLPALDVGFGRLHLGWLGFLAAFLGIVWMINLFNFMDGIDGLAASEAVVAGVAGGLLLGAKGDATLAGICWLIAASCAGFLVWNWSPAKIFMGDIGSGFLGYSFAVIAIASENAASVPLLAWGIILSVFIVDATATLLFRMRRGERWYEAHRSHVYQRAVEAGYSHSQVTLVVIALDLLLAGLAWVTSGWPSFLLPATFMSIAAILLLWVYFGRRFTASTPSWSRSSSGSRIAPLG